MEKGKRCHHACDAVHASYTDAMNKFTMSATAFMDHVHLLTEARDAHQMAITASASRRSSLDAGDRNQHYY